MEFAKFSDVELLHLFAAGEKMAQDALILRYSKVVRRCIRPYFLAGGDSEDLMQEGMIGLLSAIREYDGSVGASFHTYAELCIRRRIISAARSAARLKHSPLNDSVSLEEILSDENKRGSLLEGDRYVRSPEEHLLAREREGDFISAYSKYLSAFEEEILKYYLQGCSYQEIASNCGRSLKSVDNAVQRIRKKLARRFNYGDFS